MNSATILPTCGSSVHAPKKSVENCCEVALPGIPESQLLLNLQELPEPHHIDSPAQRWRFRNHTESRALWLRALPYIDPDYKRVVRWRNCGSQPILEHSASRGKYRITSDTCNLRICPVCSARMMRRAQERLHRTLAGCGRKSLRMITLTALNYGGSLRDQIDKLKKDFRRLRQRKSWKQHVYWGVAVIEVTRNHATRTWHAHIHAIYAGEYYPHDELSSEWHKVTGDSYVVDIRAIKDKERALQYVTKYATKLLDPTSAATTLDELKDYYLSLQREHLLIWFGDYPDPMDPRSKDNCPDDWHFLGSLEHIVKDAASGDPEAQRIMRELHEQYARRMRGPPSNN